MSATRNNKVSKGFSFRVPNLGSLMLGVLTGIGITCLLFSTFATKDITLKIPVKHSGKSAQKTHQAAAPNIAAQAKATDHTKDVHTQVSEAPKEPRFDFYTELTKNSYDTNEGSQPKSSTLDLKSAPKPIDRFVVQAGSFKSRADADALKARLTLNGLEAKIEMAKLDDKIWHRVILGPFKNEAAAREQKQLLKTMEVEGILVLLKRTE